MDIILIAAVTVDGYISRHSREVVSWSKDLHLFKEQTMGFPIIMGSNTYATLKKELVGREVIVVHRNDDPAEILKKIKAEKCFIAGGGRTNARFAKYLTHLFLTIHPLIFGRGVPLFEGLESEPELVFTNKYPVIPEAGIYQFRYEVVQPVQR